MQDDRKTKTQLVRELRTVRAKLKRLEKSEDKRRCLVDELRESEERYHSIVDNSDDAILLTVPDGRVLAANLAACRMFGRTEAEICQAGRNGIVDLTDPRLTKAIEERERKGRFKGELTLLRRDGRPFPAEVTTTVFKDQAGLQRTSMLIRDITDRQNAEETLRLLAHTIRSVGECVSITDTENNILFVNDAFLSTYGYTADELIGKPITVVRSLRSEPATEKILPTTLRGGWRGELVNRKKDGTEFPVALSTSVVRNEKGQPIALVGVAVDISERERAELAKRQARELLEREHALLSTVIENIPDEICLKDLESRYLIANDASRKALGAKSIHEMVGKTDLDYVRADLAAEHRAEEKAILKSGKAVYNRERTRYDQKTGKIQKCDISTKVPVKNQSGETIGLLIVNRDITERKLVEQSLRESEDHYRQLVEGSPFAIAVECEGRFVYVNPAGARLVGAANPQELFGKSLLEVVHPDSQETVMVRLQRLMKGKSVPTTEEKLMKLDGTPIYANVASVPTKYLDKPAAQVIFRDTTEQKRAEEELQRSEMQYRSLTENSPDLIARFDKQYRHLYVNPTAAKAGRHSPAEYVGKTMAEVGVPEEEARKWEERIRTAFETGQVVDVEDSFETPQGSRNFHTKFVLEFAPDGSIHSVQSIARDITERKRAEEQLRQAKEQYQQLVENINEVIFSSDDGGTITYISPAVSVLGSYVPSELIGRPFSDFILPEDLKIAYSGFQRVTRGELGPSEFRMLTKSGNVCWVRSSSRPIVKQGNVVGISGALTDITERKLAEEALRETSEQRRELAKHLQNVREEEKKRLTQEFHDQLGQTLTALKMDLAMLQRRVADKTKELSRADLEIEMQAMQRMIDQAIGSIREIMSELRPELLDQLGILPALEWEAERFERRSGIPCEFSSTVAAVELDTKRSIALFRIFQEALTNVSRHAQATLVRTTVRVDESYLFLEIRDNGVGISPEAENRSSSFGLIGMRERALLLGGTLEVRGVKGEGTTILLRIPLAEEDLKGGSGT